MDRLSIIIFVIVFVLVFFAGYIMFSNIDRHYIPPSPAIRHFGDNQYSIIIEDMEYTIGSTKEKIIVPNGFITDYASIPDYIKIRGLSPHEQYSRAAIVHDFLLLVTGL